MSNLLSPESILICPLPSSCNPRPSNVTWEHLYPEWIDEELYHGPTCSDLLEPAVAPDARFDIVAVKLSRRRAAN